MRATILCLNAEAFWVMPDHKEVGRSFPMVLRKILTLRVPTPDGDRVTLHFAAFQELEPYLDRELDEYRCRTKGYNYALSDAEFTEKVLWHWHPSTNFATPHVHVRGGFDGHIPTGRVTLESVVRFMIEDVGVTPAKVNWREELSAGEARHIDFRSWS